MLTNLDVVKKEIPSINQEVLQGLGVYEKLVIYPRMTRPLHNKSKISN